MSIVAALSIMAGATYAFFSDTGTSSGNVLGAGTLDMQLASNAGAYGDTTVGTFGVSGMAPGDTFSGDLFVKNTGSVAANHLDLEFANVNVDPTTAPGSATTPTMSSVLEVTALDWDTDGDGTPNLSVLPSSSTCDSIGANSNGYCDLADLQALGSAAYGDITNLTFGGSQSSPHKLHIAGNLRSDATNANQGDSDTVTVGVFMDQGAH